MKKYSSRKANKGRLAFRTPSSFICKKHEELLKEKQAGKWQKKSKKKKEKE